MAWFIAAALTWSILTAQYTNKQKAKAEKELFDEISKTKGKKVMYGYVDILWQKEAQEEWDKCIDDAWKIIAERYYISESKASIWKSIIWDAFLADTTNAIAIFSGSWEEEFARTQQQKNIYADTQVIMKHPYMRQKLWVRDGLAPYEYLDSKIPNFLNTILGSDRVNWGKSDIVPSDGTVIAITHPKDHTRNLKRLSCLWEYFVEDIKLYSPTWWWEESEWLVYFIAKDHENRKEYNINMSKRAALKLFYERSRNIQSCIQEYIKLYSGQLGTRIDHVLVWGNTYDNIHGEARDAIIEKIIIAICKQHNIGLINEGDTKSQEKIISLLTKPLSPEQIHAIVQAAWVPQ
jgi:hypothetical protein